MRFFVSSTRGNPAYPKQFGTIKLLCMPVVMQELLNVLTEAHGAPQADALATDGACYMFRSGAKLIRLDTVRLDGLQAGVYASFCNSKPASRYGIFCYSQDCKDGLAAIEELKMAEALRVANSRMKKMRRLMGSGQIDGQDQYLQHSLIWK